jgi:hypothetical protein
MIVPSRMFGESLLSNTLDQLRALKLLQLPDRFKLQRSRFKSAMITH